jgi:predicted O-methyltransferase YrrM
VRNEFRPLISNFAGLPVVYVEIGCWAGASAQWVANNILTHSASHGIGIDPYGRDRFHSDEEIAQIKQCAVRRLDEAIGSRWHWFFTPSEQALRLLSIPTIDILYIDGNHSAPNVIADLVLAWPKLRVGSLVIFDDYWTKFPKIHPNVKQAVDAVTICWAGLLLPAGTPKRQAAFWVQAKNH